MIDKHSLRSDIRILRKAFEKDHIFWDELPNLPSALIRLLGGSRVVAGYCATGSEVDPSPLLRAAADAGCQTALPWLAEGSDTLVFRTWHPGDRLAKAPFGFLQPSADAPACSPDLILTPLVGFDRALNRLGQGAGHYDRAFATKPDSLRIGIAWSVQECTALDPDPWDVPLDAVLTEKEWITGPNSRISPT